MLKDKRQYKLRDTAWLLYVVESPRVDWLPGFIFYASQDQLFHKLGYWELCGIKRYKGPKHKLSQNLDHKAEETELLLFYTPTHHTL